MFIPEHAKEYGKPNLGKNIKTIGPVNWGSEPYLITVGDDTTISFDCAFVTHDAATRVIRNLPGQDKETVIYKPINVGKNCFIGVKSIICPGVEIGDECIIGAGSVVTKSVPSHSLAAGVPARIIKTGIKMNEKAVAYEIVKD